MSSWVLFALITLTWSLWAVAALVALRSDKSQQKRTGSAGFSALPIIPLFPLAFFGAAMLINGFAESWGTFIVGWLHALLAVVFAIAIARDLRRGRTTI